MLRRQWRWGGSVQMEAFYEPLHASLAPLPSRLLSLLLPRSGIPGTGHAWRMALGGRLQARGMTFFCLSRGARLPLQGCPGAGLCQGWAAPVSVGAPGSHRNSHGRVSLCLLQLLCWLLHILNLFYPNNKVGSNPCKAQRLHWRLVYGR